MDEKKTLCRIYLVIALLLMTLAGCQAPQGTHDSTMHKPEQQAVSQPGFQLTFETGQAATYRLSSEIIRAVQFEGIRPDDEDFDVFASSMTGRLYDVTWTQTVQAVDPNNLALLAIEIKDVIYKAYRVGELIVDYESQREDNDPTAFEDLIGVTYQIRMDSKGHVVQVLGLDQAVAKIDQNKSNAKSALNMISQDTIKIRHEVKALNKAPEIVNTETVWKEREAFQFGELGGKQFDKTYTCASITPEQVIIELTGMESRDRSLSNPDMTALPFTSKEQFTGRLVMDRQAGQIDSYSETLEVNWIYTDPESTDAAQPRSGQMTAKQAFLLDRKESVQ